jgi:hypothetical protein
MQIKRSGNDPERRTPFGDPRPQIWGRSFPKKEPARLPERANFTGSFDNSVSPDHPKMRSP